MKKEHKKEDIPDDVTQCDWCGEIIEGTEYYYDGYSICFECYNLWVLKRNNNDHEH